MTEDETELAWRDEFERVGREAVANVIYNRMGSYPEPKRQFAFRWLREKERESEHRAANSDWYSKWTFWAAIVAILVGIVGVAVTLIH